MLETPNYPQTEAATVRAVLSIWRVGCMAVPLPGEKPLKIKTRAILLAKLDCLVPTATGHHASITIESTLLISISYEGVGWRVVHAKGQGIGYRKRTLLGNLGLHLEKCNYGITWLNDVGERQIRWTTCSDNFWWIPAHPDRNTQVRLRSLFTSFSIA